MANIASSKKDARRSAVRAVRNRSLKSAVKTKINRFRRALSERGEAAEQAEQLAVTAVAALDRASSKGVLHPNNVARRKSRLMKRLNAAAADSEGSPASGASSEKGRTKKATTASRGSSRGARQTSSRKQST
jgi:small subunit ribosomal protein S20